MAHCERVFNSLVFNFFNHLSPMRFYHLLQNLPDVVTKQTEVGGVQTVKR